MRKEYVVHQVRRLRKTRGEARLTATQLSQNSGINKSRLLQIEASEVKPTIGELQRIRAAIAKKVGTRSF